MGIKNLTKFLSEKYPEVFDRGVKMEEYAREKIAIDTAIFMCKFKAVNSDAWMDSFVALVVWMRKANAHPIFVLDTGMPAEKAAEKRKRAETRKRQLDRIRQLEVDIETYTVSSDKSQLLQDMYDKETKNGGGADRRRLLLLAPSQQSSFDISVVKEKLKRMKKHMFTITPKDYDNLKLLLDVLKVPWILAPDEAEKECARMVRHGEAAAVLSEDSDCLAYQSPTFLCKPDFYSNTMRRVSFDKLLNTIDMTPNQFVDFCIMCGTDYNPNIRGLGVCKSFNLMQKFKAIEHLPDKIDVSVLNHEGSRALFSIPDKDETKKQSSLFTGTPDEKELAQFFFTHNIRTDTRAVFDAMKSTTPDI